jgi:hypothetical protein
MRTGGVENRQKQQQPLASEFAKFSIITKLGKKERKKKKKKNHAAAPWMRRLTD